MTCIEIIITIVSILLSGLFSWIASWEYYKKTNRNNALSHVVTQVFTLTVAGSPSKKYSDEFRSVIMQHDLKYLKDDERELVECLFFKYLEVSAYSEDELFALALTDKVYQVIEKKNIDTKIEPCFDNDGDVLFYFEPTEYRKFHKYVKEFLNDNNLFLNYIDENNNDEYQLKINYFLNEKIRDMLRYEGKINFFEQDGLLDAIEKSKIITTHKEAKNKYYELVEEFEAKFSKEINPLWNELFLENEGKTF